MNKIKNDNSKDIKKPHKSIWTCEEKRKMTYWSEIIGVNI